MGYALFVLPFAFLAGLVFAVATDMRSGRGWGLTILTSLLLACSAFVVVSTVHAAQQQTEPPSLHNPSPLVWLVFYFVPAAYAMGLTMIGAASVAISAHHRLWLAAFFVAVFVPVSITVFPHPFWILTSDHDVQNAGFLGILFVPEATVLAYSVTRVIRPVRVARALPSPTLP
ncbi:MAG TPA: hypothetical protein VF120_02270 [Ktedonobacterales bacterium]